MSAATNYWATDEDEHFEQGHYVEAWELQRINLLSTGTRELLSRQHAMGNKVRAIAEGLVELQRPLGDSVWALPEGLVFWCPLQEQHIGHYDGDEDGVVVCLATGGRVVPTGYEGTSVGEPPSRAISAA